VALARALVIEPDILLLDEPLSNLDAKLREETRIEIKRLQTELGVTTVYVTHDQTEAMAMSDRIMVMENGYVKQIGTPQDIYNRPENRFVASFIGETNMVKATVKNVTDTEVEVESEEGIRLVGMSMNAASSATLQHGNTVYISIRPELLRGGPGENELVGKIVFVEFTGVSINYVIDVNGFEFNTMMINDGSELLSVGDTMTVHVPIRNVYFLGE